MSASLVLCSYSAIFALGTIRGDIAPAALNVWGLVFAARLLRDPRTLRAEIACASCFGLAFLAKPTTLFGLAATCTTLFLKGSRHRLGAWRLLVLTVAGVVVLLAAANAASDGRMLESLVADATAGGGIRSLVSGPWRFLYAAVRQDPLSITLFVMFSAGLVTLPPSGWRDLTTWAGVFTLLAMGLIYGTPGVDFNHLIDFYAVGLVFVIVQIARGRLPSQSAGTAIAISAILSMAMLGSEFRRMREYGDVTRLPEVARQVREMDNEGKPLFAQNPLIPILNGTRPFLLDPWMFRMLGRNDARLRQSLNEKVREQFFAVVVLGGFSEGFSADPRTVSGQSFFADWYGSDFLPTLFANYELTSSLPPYFIYRRRQDHPR